MAGRKKAMGLYERLNDEGKSVYDKIIAKSFKLGLDKFSKREIEYLNDLYTRKMDEILAQEREFDTKDALTLAISMKLKSYTSTKEYSLRRNITKPLTKEQKQFARNKLLRVVNYSR